MIMFLYKITNIVNKKCYVGFTSLSVEERYKQHIRKSRHTSYKQKLYNAIRKYGIDNFIVEEIYRGDDALQREDEFIKRYEAEYNMSEGGGSGRHSNPHKPYGNSNRAKTYIVTYPDGTEEKIFNVSEFARKHGLDKSSICEVCKGRRNHTKGFKFRYN